MLRIRDALVKLMYKSNLSKNEIVAALELIQVANLSGITQVHYTEMAENIGCNVSTFYNCLKKLEATEIIERGKDQDHKQEILIGIFNNNFAEGSEQRDYVKIDNVFFTDGIYKQLCAGEIRVMLYLMFRTAKGGYTENIGSQYHDKNKLYYTDNYKSIAEQLGITRRMAKKYLKGLSAKKLISIGEQKVEKKSKRYDVITVAHKLLNKSTVAVTEKGMVKNKKITAMMPCYKHWIKNFCRRLDKKIPDSITLNDTAELLEQYMGTAKKRGKNIYALLESAIGSLKTEALNSKTVHNILRALLEREGMLVYY